MPPKGSKMPEGSRRQSKTSSASSPSGPESRPASPGSKQNGRSGSAERPRLTEAQKKDNHIASEKKRRQAIREGFDRLTEIVPGLEGQARSEGIVLNKTTEYIKEKVDRNEQLIRALEAQGVRLDRTRGIEMQLAEQGLFPPNLGPPPPGPSSSWPPNSEPSPSSGPSNLELSSSGQSESGPPIPQQPVLEPPKFQPPNPANKRAFRE